SAAPHLEGARARRPAPESARRTLAGQACGSPWASSSAWFAVSCSLPFARAELTEPGKGAEIHAHAQVPHQPLEVDAGQESPEVEIADEATEVDPARKGGIDRRLY